MKLFKSKVVFFPVFPTLGVQNLWDIWPQNCCFIQFRTWCSHVKRRVKSCRSAKCGGRPLLLGAQTDPKIGSLWGLSSTHLQSSSSELISHVSCDSSEIFQENRQKPTYWHNSALFGAKNLAYRGHFTHTLKTTYIMPVNHVLGSGIKNFLRKWQKSSEIAHFDIFFVIKNLLEKFEHTHLQK